MAFKRAKWRTQRQKTGGQRKKWILIVLLVMIIVTIQSITYVERNLKPPIMHLAKIRVKQLGTEAINKAITSQISAAGPSNELIDWKTDAEGEISGFMLNYNEHMRITSSALSVVQTTLQEMETIEDHVPVGRRWAAHCCLPSGQRCQYELSRKAQLRLTSIQGSKMPALI